MLVRFRYVHAAMTLIIAGYFVPVAPIKAAESTTVAPSYRIFATREGLVGHRTANGHRIQPRDRFVALPFRGVLASNGGHEFQVRVTYRDRSVVLPVWDVGPWNISDDYWSPKRRYADLPTGTPMAQAAYQRGYNGGRDDSGRRVGAPNGIDIADGAFWDDLGMSGSDWVEVSFLWTGADPGDADRQRSEDAAQTTIEPNAIVIDNNGDERFWTTKGIWEDASCGVNDHSAWARGTHDTTAAQRAGWNVHVPTPGRYEVLVAIPNCGERATRAAHYRVINGDTTTEHIIDQRRLAGRWASLGTYTIVGDATVELSTVVSNNEIVRFDAVRWVPRS